jgi:hypothetical protein
MAIKKSKFMPGDRGAAAGYVSGTLNGGKVHVTSIKWDGAVDGAASTGDVIELFELPAGAKILPHLSAMVGNQATTTATIKVGSTSVEAGLACTGAVTLAAADIDVVNEVQTVSATLAAGGIAADKAVMFMIAYQAV